MKAMFTLMAGGVLTLVTFGLGFICGGLITYDATHADVKKNKEDEAA